MEEKVKKSKSVCTPFDEDTYNKLRAKAGNTQSVASVIRIAVMHYLSGDGEGPMLTGPKHQPAIEVTGVVSNITAMERQAPTPERKNAGEKSVVSPLIIAKYDIPEAAIPTYGPPTTCPVCLKTHGELGDRALQIVNSGPGKGAWACYECFSSGRWTDDTGVIVLKNTQAEQSGEGDTTSPVKG